jgi:phenylalanine-4-hydroxylase
MLTTTKAPFIEHAREDGRLFIEQPYHLYSMENHQVWGTLYRRMEPVWLRFANPWFLEGLDVLRLGRERVPRLAEVNRLLARRTGFQARAVSGYVPSNEFFACLARREFPTTVTIRSASSLDYLPEPDIFHDIAGHVPMHTDPLFADVLVQFGRCAATAAEQAPDATAAASVLRGMARFFWFSIEFGLMQTADGLRAYGSGLLSSAGELAYALESNLPKRTQFDLREVVNQPFEINHFQPILYYVDSFRHLYEQVTELEHWVREGRLDRVAPDAPPTELASFCDGLPAEAST